MSEQKAMRGIWPDFIAPSKYEKPDPRWEDPGLPDFRLIWKIARECGYSVGLHGSMKRDCDMIAAPWTEAAVSAEELIDRLCTGMDAFILPLSNDPVKPHGRRAWCLQIRDAYKKVLDVSVMPRATPTVLAADLAAALDKIERLDRERKLAEAQVDRLLALSTSIDADCDAAIASLQASGQRLIELYDETMCDLLGEDVHHGNQDSEEVAAIRAAFGLPARAALTTGAAP